MKLNSIRAKLNLLFLAFASLVIVSAGATFWGLESQKQDALVINLAGRQRMLSQQMAREAFQIGQAGQEKHLSSLLETAQVFEKTLDALKNGGLAPYLPGQSVQIPAANDPRIQDQLAKLDPTWLEFSEAIHDLALAAPGSENFTSAQQTIEQLSPELLDQADALVRLYEKASGEKITRLRLIQTLFLVIALLLLGSGSVIVAQSVIAPLHRLGRAANQIGSGDLGTPVQVNGPQEITLLTRTMETMRQELEGSRDELLQWTDRLEQRVAQRTNELQALNQVSSEIASRLELPQVLNSVVAKTQQLLDAEVVFLCLLDDEGQSMSLQATHGPKEAIQAACTPAREMPASQVLATDAALSCGTDDCRGACQIVAPAFRKSHLVAPLRTGERVIGALCVASQAPRDFAPEALALLNRLANVAAIAIENARLYAQVERAASLEERQCIAAEMHDGLAQTLSYLQLISGQASLQVETGQNAQALQSLERIGAALDRAIEDTRRAIASLQEQGPLHEVLQDQLRAVAQEFSTSQGAPVAWQSSLNSPLVVSHHDTEQVIRVVHEALLNASRHGRAAQMIVRLELDQGEAIVTVQDDGRGFDPAHLRAENGRHHFGLKIMRARAARLGGRIEIDSAPGAGTRVRLAWPVEK